MRHTIVRHPGRLLGLLNLTLGGVLLGGGPWRTSSYSFVVAREAAPIPVWAVAFLLGGLACLLALRLRWWGVAALMFGAGVHTFWAGCFIAAALRDDRAALTAIPVYLFLALLHLLTGLRLAGMVPMRRRWRCGVRATPRSC